MRPLRVLEHARQDRRVLRRRRSRARRSARTTTSRPTNDIYAVVAGPDGTPRLEVFHWGLIPVWAKDRKVGQKMINARAETLAEKPAYKGVFKKTRCIIPMDGFYEWKAGEPGGPVTKAGKPAKQPMFIHRLDGEPLAVAGLWSAWRDKAAGPDADWLHSATVVTTSANGTMAPIHDRMPVILPQSAWATLAGPGRTTTSSRCRACSCRRPTRCSTCTPVVDRRQQRPQQGPRARRAVAPPRPDPDVPGARARDCTLAQIASSRSRPRTAIARSSARIASAAASRSSRSTDAAALANDSWDMTSVGMTWTCMCGTS